MNENKTKNDVVKEMRTYIRKLVEKYNNIDLIKDEINDLKLKLYRCKDIDFSELGFKSSHSYKGIEDLIISCKDLIYIKETEIETIESDYRKLMLYVNKLNKNEIDVINLKYINKNEEHKNYTNTAIAQKLHQSLATVKRIEKSALLKINKLKEENIKRMIA